MSEEFYKWCLSFNDWRRIIFHKQDPYSRTGYIIAWDDPNLDNINKKKLVMNEEFLKWLQKQKYAHSYPTDAGWAIHNVALYIRGRYTAAWGWHFILKIDEYEKHIRK